jgi:hypothetical protein
MTHFAHADRESEMSDAKKLSLEERIELIQKIKAIRATTSNYP